MLLNILFSLFGRRSTQQEYVYGYPYGYSQMQPTVPEDSQQDYFYGFPYGYGQPQPTVPEDDRQESNQEYQYPYYWWVAPPEDGK